MTARTRILGLVLFASLILAVALIPVGRRNHRQIVAIALSESGAIVAGTSSGRIAIWDGSSPVPRETTLRKNTPLNDLQFSPDGRYLAVGGPDLILFSTANLAARTIREDRRNYGSVRFSQDGASILTITGAATIELIDIAIGSTVMATCCSTIYGEVAFTPGGASIVNAGHWPRLWTPLGSQTASLTTERQFETFRPIAFASSDRVLMGSQDGRVYVWNLLTQELIGRSPAHPGYVDTIAVLDDGWIAYASFGKPIRMWNLESGATRILESARPTSNIASADRASMLFGTSSGTVEIRSATGGEILRTLELP